MQPRDPKFQLLANTIGFDPRRVDELEKYRTKNEERKNSALTSIKNTQKVSYSYTNHETNQVEIRYTEVPLQKKYQFAKESLFFLYTNQKNKRDMNLWIYHNNGVHIVKKAVRWK